MASPPKRNGKSAAAGTAAAPAAGPAGPGRDDPKKPVAYVVDGFVVETYVDLESAPPCEVCRPAEPIEVKVPFEKPYYANCRICLGTREGDCILLCDDCDRGFHIFCLNPPLSSIPEGEWLCSKCTKIRALRAHETGRLERLVSRARSQIDSASHLPLKLQLKLRRRLLHAVKGIEDDPLPSPKPPASSAQPADGANAKAAAPPEKKRGRKAKVPATPPAPSPEPVVVAAAAAA
eukprot:CAMPEP_0184734334 /NCGR_PEP_ID=MMETSP0314-20130426/60189_1 /TAXON_ID=38298 /ORGANISM="Rhodella maculata, Strain CCMP 736" /LENGTH=233 /DNA_ID=CAMNT_0027201267 /DNA_START=8 /DNA_END=706 /DNA_ORIENTATION=+